MERRNFLKGTAAGIGAVIAPTLTLAQDQKVIKFGGSVPMTGVAAETGLNVLQGYQAAVKFINEELGGLEISGEKYRLELSLFDDASDPSRAVNLIQRQIDDGIMFYLGSFGSNIVLPTSNVVESANGIMVQTGGGGDQIFTQGRKRIFGVYPRSSRQFQSTINMFTSLEPKVKSASIIYTNDPFSITQAEGARSGCEAVGIEVKDYIALPAEVNDVTNVLTTIRQTSPDLVVCLTHDHTSILIARQMVATDTNAPMLYQVLGPATQAYKDALGNYAEGVVTSSYWSERQDNKCPYFGSSKGFADYFRANFDRSLVYHVAGGALCILTYAEAARRAGSIDADAVRDQISALDFECFYGRVRFSEDGDGDAVLMGPILIQRQKDGIEVIAPPESASAPVIYPVPNWKDRA